MSFSVVSSIVLPRATPALLIRTVGFPREERMEDAALAMAEGEERSHLKKRTDGGAVICQWPILITILGFIRSSKHIACFRRTLISQILHIQHRNLDPLLSQQLHHNLADAVTASCYDHHLATPHIRIIRPVIRDRIV